MENVGIRIDWLDRLFREILYEKEPNELIKKVNVLRVRAEGAENLLTSSKDQRKQAEEQLKKKEGPASSRDYTIKVFKDSHASR